MRETGVLVAGNVRVAPLTVAGPRAANCQVAQLAAHSATKYCTPGVAAEGKVI